MHIFRAPDRRGERISCGGTQFLWFLSMELASCYPSGNIPIILSWLPDFWKICAPVFYQISLNFVIFCLPAADRNKTNIKTKKFEPFPMHGQSQLDIQTIHLIVQSILHISAFSESHSQAQAYFFYILCLCLMTAFWKSRIMHQVLENERYFCKIQLLLTIYQIFCTCTTGCLILRWIFNAFFEFKGFRIWPDR